MSIQRFLENVLCSLDTGKFEILQGWLAVWKSREALLQPELVPKSPEAEFLPQETSVFS